MSGNIVRADLLNYEGASNLLFHQKIKEMQRNGKKIHHFGFGESPFPVPTCFVNALKKHAHRSEYLPVAGIPELITKIIEFHKMWDGFHHFHPDSVIMGPGSKQLIFNILSVFGGEVLLLSPSWTTYLPQCQLTGRRSYLVPTSFENKFWPKPADLETFVSTQCSNDGYKILILNSPNNPSGLMCSEEFLQELATVCRRNKILIISDEIYARMQLTKEHVSIAKYYPEGTIITTGFSKWASAGGWRAGYAMFLQELASLRKAVANAGTHSYTCGSAPIQYALAEGMDWKEEIQEHIYWTRQILQTVGDYVFKELTQTGVKCHPAEGGYYLMPDFQRFKTEFQEKGIQNGQEMCDAMLRDASVALMPCDPCFLRPMGELSTRFCFVNFDGVQALNGAMGSYSKDRNLDEAYLQKYCSPVTEGVQSLVSWLKGFHS